MLEKLIALSLRSTISLRDLAISFLQIFCKKLKKFEFRGLLEIFCCFLYLNKFEFALVLSTSKMFSYAQRVQKFKLIRTIDK